MNALVAFRVFSRPATTSPVLEFLAPTLIRLPSKRYLSCSSRSSTHAEPTQQAYSNAPSNKPSAPLTQAQRDYLDSALRVNQAGELAATLIYKAQTPPLVRAHPHLRPLMQHMYDQEAGHLSTFNAMLAQHRIRPTALTPVWRAAASFLGWSTAVLGREAAMACTEAVEMEIGDHYNSQVREVLEWVREREQREEDTTELRELVGTLKRIRDEELEHLDEAVDGGAKGAGGYEILTNVIRAGCRGAIWITKKV